MDSAATFLDGTHDQVTGLLRTASVSVVKRENPPNKPAEASHQKEPARTTAPRDTSDDLWKGKSLMGDPKVEEKKK